MKRKKKKEERKIHSLIDRGIPSVRDDTPIKQLASHRSVSRDHPYKFTLCLHSVCPFIKPLAGVPPPLSRHPTRYNGNGANGSETKRLWQPFERKTCV